MDRNTYLFRRNSLEPINKLDIQKSWRVLDIGCGVGRDVNYVNSLGANAVGLDIEPWAKAKDIMVGNGECLPFNDNSFDCVYSVLVIGHVEDEEMAMREVLRVLRSGGKFCFVYFNSTISNLRFPLWLFLGRKLCADIYRLPKHNHLEKKLKRIGFKINEIYSSDYMPPLLAILPQGMRGKIYDILDRNNDKLMKNWLFKWKGRKLIAVGEK
jgi:ubiquinone/menaquinone biosynthesis C-methylase UbiE